MMGNRQVRIKGDGPAEGQRLCEIREGQQVQRPRGSAVLGVPER